MFSTQKLIDPKYVITSGGHTGYRIPTDPHGCIVPIIDVEEDSLMDLFSTIEKYHEDLLQMTMEQNRQSREETPIDLIVVNHPDGIVRKTHDGRVGASIGICHMPSRLRPI